MRAWKRLAPCLQGGEIRVSDAEDIGPLAGAEAAGDFLFDLGHACGLFGEVVGERNAAICSKTPDIVRVGTQAAQEVRRLALPGTPAFARGRSLNAVELSSLPV